MHIFFDFYAHTFMYTYISRSLQCKYFYLYISCVIYPPSSNHFSLRLGPADLALSRRRELIPQILRRGLRLADGILGEVQPPRPWPRKTLPAFGPASSLF